MDAVIINKLIKNCNSSIKIKVNENIHTIRREHIGQCQIVNNYLIVDQVVFGWDDNEKYEKIFINVDKIESIRCL